MTLTLQPLPVGIQDFAQLREGGFLYVDKTESVYQLVTTSKAAFLSRPRRFGKSLLCSVFANLYEGRKDLFHALCILAFSGKGLVLSEVPNALGRSDLVIDLPEECWIFEFKRDSDTDKALEQMKRKRYENQWEGRLLADGSVKSVRKVAVTFGTVSRNIVNWVFDEG